ncbi:class I SAM-dependent DNA methyltransferase [Veronia nyctiphanis]|nr:class I SAM-dependent methyltransferase [Veronia nyctiphanis]
MYKEYASEYDVAIQGNLYNAKFERPSLLSLLTELEGKKLLDLGCGPGVYAQELISRGASVTAIDNSEDMIEITRAKIGSNHKAYVQDISIGLPNEKSGEFDVVICPLAIHYLKDLNPLFSDVRRVLKHNGQFIFSTNHPNVDFRSSPSGDYFATEEINEEWHTLGRPVPVTYYRRPISALAGSISCSGMVISNIFEGLPTEELKKASLAVFEKLSTKLSFMFYVCKLA